jgi:hypothetical protein
MTRKATTRKAESRLKVRKETIRDLSAKAQGRGIRGGAGVPTTTTSQTHSCRLFCG